MSLRLQPVAVTDRGLVRGKNEDALLAGARLIAVADGMGGLPAGDVASEIAVAVLAPLADGTGDRPPLEALAEAVETANRRIAATANGDGALSGMGTTLTALLLTGNQIALVHVGDSRAYLLRGGMLAQLTRDDTYVQALVDRGALTPAEAHRHPHRSLVTQALQGREISIARRTLDACPGDRLLVCSDGLSDLVEDEDIEAALRDLPDREACASRLVELALAAGGIDNVTAVVADVLDSE
ncbi:PP2C family protein-serine/threonine phosphatase [Rhizomonospora bruguierae]|uniref:PP2C family protein-serine/threonine phosphatase n=1 Tax=Rhizomonospora bruguierae TaxID=1581705 RepID=UPI001BCC6950|nr:protein phosphatase 2C domain-containing protein [Micromonospora sp. NBRC 107566]